MHDLPIYVLEREFDAPCSLVWKSWSQPELLAKWYGPGVETIIHRLDLRAGGLWLNEMKRGDQSYYQRIEYTEVITHRRIVCLMSDCDDQWNVIQNPMMEDWPKILKTIVTFEEIEGKTKMTLTWSPYDASEAEIACFKNAIENFGKGWHSGMDIIAEILFELKNSDL